MIGKIDSNVNVFQKAINASWLRNEAIADNIANADTPNYKRKDVSFESQLQQALISGNEISSVELQAVEPKIIVDKSNLEYRMDGNNVDIDVEMAENAKNVIKYNALIDQVNYNFGRLKRVMEV